MSPQQPRRELCLSKNLLTRPLPLEPGANGMTRRLEGHDRCLSPEERVGYGGPCGNQVVPDRGEHVTPSRVVGASNIAFR